MHKSYIWLAGALFVGTLAGVAAAVMLSRSSAAAPAASAPAAG